MENQSMVSSVATLDDLCNWEFVRRLDFGIEGGFDDDDTLYDLVESIHSSSSEGEDDEKKEGPTYDDNIKADSEENRGQNDAFYELYDGSSNMNGKLHDDDGDVEEEDGYDMEDEMVPWDRLMRQRIRKSEKNSFRRSAKTKKSALVFTRPGCVRGKHGLGLMVY